MPADWMFAQGSAPNEIWFQLRLIIFQMLTIGAVNF